MGFTFKLKELGNNDYDPNALFQVSGTFQMIYINGSGPVSAADIKTLVDYLLEALQQPGTASSGSSSAGSRKYKIFYDLRESSIVSLDTIKELINQTQVLETLCLGKVAANAILVSGTTVERALSVVFAIRPPNTPTKVTTSVEEACDFLN